MILVLFQNMYQDTSIIDAPNTVLDYTNRTACTVETTQIQSWVFYGTRVYIFCMKHNVYVAAQVYGRWTAFMTLLSSAIFNFVIVVANRWRCYINNSMLDANENKCTSKSDAL